MFVTIVRGMVNKGIAVVSVAQVPPSISICCENSFSLSFVNITDENEWEKEQRSNLTMI